MEKPIRKRNSLAALKPQREKRKIFIVVLIGRRRRDEFFYEFSLSPLRREYGEVGGGIRRPKATIGLKAFLAPPTTFLLDLRNFMQIIFRGGASFHLLTCTVDIFPRISINNIGSGNPSARFNLHKQIRIGFEK